MSKDKMVFWGVVVGLVLLWSYVNLVSHGNEVAYEGEACETVQHEWYEVTGEDVRHVSYCTINDKTGQLRLRFIYEEAE